MKKSILCKLVLPGLLALGLLGSAQAGPRVLMQTSEGDITIELNEEKAPDTVKNFLAYVDEGFYDGTVFHRVIKDFMIQGGGFTQDYSRKPTHAPVHNEADNGLKNNRGTIAMARTNNPNSATSQFFINHKDNEFLNYRSPDVRGWGYCVFGEVVDGMDVVDRIAAKPTGIQKGMRDVPKEPVTIENVTRVSESN